MSEIETFSDFCNNNLCDTCRFKKIAIDEGCSNCEKLFMREHDKQIRAEVIDEVKEKINDTGAEITFNLPVEEILGEDIDLDDFAMLVQDAVQVYRKMVLGVLEQLKSQVPKV